MWLVRPLGFRLAERRVRRSGLDYWQHLQYRVVDHWQQMAEQLPRGRTWFFSAHASRPFTDASFREGDFFVFGSETQGLDPGLLAEHADRVLNIPTTENVRSLNLANTVAIVLYEALRQAGDPTDQGAGER